MSQVLGCPPILPYDNHFCSTWNMAVSILFRPKNRAQGKIFRTFRESFSNFSPARKYFRRPKFFWKFSWQRCDSFGPEIVKIRAILTVFRPFEISRKFVPYKLLQNFLCGYKIEMARFKISIGFRDQMFSFSENWPANYNFSLSSKLPTNYPNYPSVAEIRN